MKKNMCLIIGMAILLIGMSITPSTGINLVKQSTKAALDGNTLYVGCLGPGCYSKIQDAIDDASDGDIVFVYDESSPYNESIEIDKTINLIGENRDTTKICSIDTITILADFINISGFSIFNYWGYSLSICSSYNTISYNNFTKSPY